MKARNEAYLLILNRGLLAVRNLAFAGKTAICQVEADYLHNIPSLINEANEHRHHYHIVPERKGYLAKLSELGESEYLTSMTTYYAEPWKVLMRMAFPELQAINAEHETEILSLNARDPRQP